MPWGRSRWQTPAVDAPQQPAPHPTAGCRAVWVNLPEDPGSGEDFDFTGLDEESGEGI